MTPAVRSLQLDDPVALAIAVAAGAHGVYVHNALAAGDGDGFLFPVAATGPRGAIAGGDEGLCWFGPRGNLVVLGPDRGDARWCHEIATAIVDARRPWRIAMGPRGIVDALRERVATSPLVHRDQIYYAGDRTSAARELVRADMRPAQRADRDRLVQATLLLNQSDLNLDPARVDRRWLRDTIDERIADGTTRVLGPLGGPQCKLDLGSDGPGGAVIEGVFTFPEQRGHGLAAALVASCLAAASQRVILHVGQHNRPARAAYARAGMQEAGSCRLLLLN